MNMKKIIAGTALVALAGAGFSSMSNAMRQSTLNGFYRTAAEVQTELKTGNKEIARRNYEEMWDSFNQTRRNELRDPMGQMSQADADAFEARANWNALYSSTNDLRSYFPKK